MMRLVQRVKSTSLSDLVKSSKMEKLEAAEMTLLNPFGASVIKSLPRLSPHQGHPIRRIAKEARHTLRQEYETSQSLHKAIDQVDKILDSNIVDYTGSIANIGALQIGNSSKEKIELDMMIETGLRLQFTKNYFARIKQAMDGKEVQQTDITSSVACRLLDSIMMGTAAERIQEHIGVYGKHNGKMTQDQFQSCLYALYEPEVETVSNAMLTLDKLVDKKMKKKVIPNAIKTFLLDNVELNTQVRCMMAWSDPDYTGFKPLADDYAVTVPDLIKSRQEFYKEGTQVGEKFVEEILARRREFYNNKQANRETMARGLLFFIATCFADWYVCVM